MARTYYEKPRRIEKLTKEEKLDLMLDLINSFTIVKKPIETALFLQDLLTANEIRNLSLRLRIAKLLLSRRTYNEIRELTHASTATITKVSVWLEEGGAGFKSVIARLPERYKIPKRLPPGPIEYHLPQVLFAVYQYLGKRMEDKLATRFLKGIKGKEAFDRDLQEIFDEYYKRHKKNLQDRHFSTLNR